MNVLTALKENRYNEIIIDVDTVEVISPCKLRARIVNMQYNIKNTVRSNLLPFKCIFKSIRLKNTVQLGGIASLEVTTEANSVRVAGSNEIFRLPEVARICIIELSEPLTNTQISDLIQHTDSLSYNPKYFDFN